jgi:site-specific DNA-methyltransferase (adenine-specific)
MRLDLDGFEDIDVQEMRYDASLSQWMTPSWAAEAIVAHALRDLPSNSLVVEPSCGVGRFLNALNHRFRVLGVEIDPALAAAARARTGASVVEGDFRTVHLEFDRCDAFIGNPPFRMDVFDGMLERMHAMLPQGGPAVMVLPTSAFQTSSRVMRYNRRWSISQQMMPRGLFPGIRLPLMLATFIKDDRPMLTGFLLYPECREIEEMPQIYRRALAEGSSGWRAVVEEALRRLGGEATVSQVCAEIAPRRPTGTTHWRAKVRQQLRANFPRRARATYALAA